ncbi:UNVERIFIED_CONTAM: Glucan endo-1,3-beta-glucosidase, basic isoform [Sesamum angustifolium]|uniref:Glucan endo-1,3-beta-glucosidase, basic isoform n=1 Tax=Sesamum angustifolium TaxID=2727405 RepID=A0AAW2PVN6_9LAMI
MHFSLPGLAPRSKSLLPQALGFLANSTLHQELLLSPKSGHILAPSSSSLRRISITANLHTCLPYISNPKGIGMDYALFSAPSSMVRDGFYKYWNLFDVLVDAIYVAVEKYGGNNVEVVVSETGWPSAGETAATVQNAKIFINNLIQLVKGGTPRRPERLVEAYIYNLIVEDLKKP